MTRAARTPSAFAFLLVFLGLILGNRAHAGEIYIVNASFEEPDLGGGTEHNFTDYNFGPGWSIDRSGTTNYGVAIPGAGPDFYGASNPLPAPFAGNQVGYADIYAGEYTYVNSDGFGRLQANTLYTLHFAVGHRGDAYSTLSYGVGIVVDGVELGAFSTGIPAPGTIQDLVYTLDTRFDASVRIRGEADGFAQMNFDNVRLQSQAVPEPSTIALGLVAGLLGAAGAVRRRLKAEATA